jgi:hypothetical protein
MSIGALWTSIEKPFPIGHNFTNRGAGNDAIPAHRGIIIADRMNISTKKALSF